MTLHPSSATAADKNRPLIEDIRLLGRILGKRIFSLIVTGNQPALFPVLVVLPRMASSDHGMESRHGDDDQEIAGEARRGAVAGPAVAL